MVSHQLMLFDVRTIVTPAEERLTYYITVNIHVALTLRMFESNTNTTNSNGTKWNEMERKESLTLGEGLN